MHQVHVPHQTITVTVIKHVGLVVIADPRHLERACLAGAIPQVDLDFIHEVRLIVLRTLMDGDRPYILDINTDDQLPHVSRNCERREEFAAQARVQKLVAQAVERVRAHGRIIAVATLLPLLVRVPVDGFGPAAHA